MTLRSLFTAEECRRLDRCVVCGWHPLQGHHADCPRQDTR